MGGHTWWPEGLYNIAAAAWRLGERRRARGELPREPAGRRAGRVTRPWPRSSLHDLGRMALEAGRRREAERSAGARPGGPREALKDQGGIAEALTRAGRAAPGRGPPRRRARRRARRAAEIARTFEQPELEWEAETLGRLAYRRLGQLGGGPPLVRGGGRGDRGPSAAGRGRDAGPRAVLRDQALALSRADALALGAARPTRRRSSWPSARRRGCWPTSCSGGRVDLARLDERGGEARGGPPARGAGRRSTGRSTRSGCGRRRTRTGSPRWRPSGRPGGPHTRRSRRRSMPSTPTCRCSAAARRRSVRRGGAAPPGRSVAACSSTRSRRGTRISSC